MQDITVNTFLDRKNENISERDQLLADHLLVLKSEETLEAVLRKFHGAKILAAPVVFPNGQYRMVSVMDILDGINDIGADLVFSLPVSELCNHTGYIDYKTIPKDSFLKEAIQLLADVHRVLVVNEDGIPFNIISHLDIVDWCAKEKSYAPQNVANIPVGHLMTPSSICVHKSDPVFEAFKKCLKMKYTGIGVVDEKGELEANLSISMLQFFTPENFHHLLRLSVGQFLEETSGMLIKLPKTIHYNDTFSNAIKVMHNNHVHRLFVVDQSGKNVGVFSASDVVQSITRQYTAEANARK